MTKPAGRVSGQVAVVTGGASGVGRAIALRFAAGGARVAIADVQREAGEPGSPEEIASVALFLASDDASSVTGQVVSPNGGLLT